MNRPNISCSSPDNPMRGFHEETKPFPKNSTASKNSTSKKQGLTIRNANVDADQHRFTSIYDGFDSEEIPMCTGRIKKEPTEQVVSVTSEISKQKESPMSTGRGRPKNLNKNTYLQNMIGDITRNTNNAADADKIKKEPTEQGVGVTSETSKQKESPMSTGRGRPKKLIKNTYLQNMIGDITRNTNNAADSEHFKWKQPLDLGVSKASVPNTITSLPGISNIIDETEEKPSVDQLVERLAASLKGAGVSGFKNALVSMGINYLEKEIANQLREMITKLCPLSEQRTDSSFESGPPLNVSDLSFSVPQGVRSEVVWKVSEQFLCPTQAYEILSNCLTDRRVPPIYQGLQHLSFGEHNFGIYGVFAAGSSEETNTSLQLRSCLPMWSSAMYKNGVNLQVLRQSSDKFLKEVYILTAENGTNLFPYMIVAWFRNEHTVHYTNAAKFPGTETVVEMISKCAPTAAIPPMLLGCNQFPSYAVIMDKDNYSLQMIKSQDGAQWCSGTRKIRSRYRKVVLNDKYILRVIENVHPVLDVYRRIYVILSNDKQQTVMSNYMLYYTLCDSFFKLEVFKQSFRKRLTPYEVETVRKEYEGRDSNEALKHLMKLGLVVTKKQVQNQKKNVPTAVRGASGRRFQIDACQMVNMATLVGDKGKVVLQKGAKGELDMDGFFVFSKVLLLALNQATTRAEYDQHIALCEELHRFGSNKKAKYEFLSGILVKTRFGRIVSEKMFMEKADPGCYLPVATPMQCDTSFDLSNLSFTFILMGIRGFRYADTGKMVMVVVSMMAHLKRDLAAHQAHKAELQKEIDKIMKSHPHLRDRLVTMFVTDGEVNLSTYAEISICSEAKHLGCAFHLKRNLMMDKVSEDAIRKAFGTKITENDFDKPVLREGLLTALDPYEYYDMLGKLRTQITERDYLGFASRDDKLYWHFALGVKLIAGTVAQFLTTNKTENWNGYLKKRKPGRHMPHEVMKEVCTIVDEIYDGLIRAKTMGDSQYLCENPIKNWNQFTPSQRTAALIENCLEEAVEDMLRNLDSLFLRDVGIIYLNEAIRIRQTYEVNPVSSGYTVRNLSSKHNAEVKFVSVKRFPHEDKYGMELICTASACSTLVFCIHKVQVLLALPSDEQKMVADYFIDSASLRKAILKKGGNLRGCKPGKRVGSKRSKINGDKNAVGIEERYSDNDNESDESTCSENSTYEESHLTPIVKVTYRDKDNLSARILERIRKKQNKNPTLSRNLVNKVLGVKQHVRAVAKAKRCRKKRKSTDDEEPIEDSYFQHIADTAFEKGFIEDSSRSAPVPTQKSLGKTPTASQKNHKKNTITARVQNSDTPMSQNCDESQFMISPTDSAWEETMRRRHCALNETEILPMRNRLAGLSQSQLERFAETFPEKTEALVCTSEQTTKAAADTSVCKRRGRPPKHPMGAVEAKVSVVLNSDTPMSQDIDESQFMISPTDSAWEETMRRRHCALNETEILPMRNRLAGLSQSQLERFAETFPEKTEALVCTSEQTTKAAADTSVCKRRGRPPKHPMGAVEAKVSVVLNSDTPMSQDIDESQFMISPTDSAWEETMRRRHCALNETEILPMRNRLAGLSQSQLERFAETFPEKTEALVCTSEQTTKAAADTSVCKRRGRPPKHPMGAVEAKVSVVLNSDTPMSQNCDESQFMISPTDSAWEETMRRRHCALNETEILPMRNRLAGLSQSQLERFAETFPEKTEALVCTSEQTTKAAADTSVCKRRGRPPKHPMGANEVQVIAPRDIDATPPVLKKRRSKFSPADPFKKPHLRNVVKK